MVIKDQTANYKAFIVVILFALAAFSLYILQQVHAFPPQPKAVVNVQARPDLYKEILGLKETEDAIQKGDQR